MTLCGSDRILYSRAAATLNLLPSYSTVNCNEGKGWRQPAHPWACQSFIGDSGCRSTHGARINQNVTKYIGRKNWSCGETGRRRGHPGDLLVGGNSFPVVLLGYPLGYYIPYYIQILMLDIFYRVGVTYSARRYGIVIAWESHFILL